MSAPSSPSEARVEAIAEFERLYRITCSCPASSIELREEDGWLRCAIHDTPILFRRRRVAQ
jgi:hypothetical protein